MGRLAQTLGVTNKRLFTTTTAETNAQTLVGEILSGAVQISSTLLLPRLISKDEYIVSCRLIRYSITSSHQLQHEMRSISSTGTLLCFAQDGKLQIATSAASASHMFTSRSMKLVVGWRVAPACCAAQSVSRRGPRCTVQLFVHFGPLEHAVPIGKTCALGQQNYTTQLFRVQNAAHQRVRQ